MSKCCSQLSQLCPRACDVISIPIATSQDLQLSATMVTEIAIRVISRFTPAAWLPPIKQPY